jgi:hypothetical protein
MRTTLAIDDDVLAAAKEIASHGRTSVGEVISELARRALQPAKSAKSARNGVPLLRVALNTPRVTSALVRKLNEEIL